MKLAEKICAQQTAATIADRTRYGELVEQAAAGKLDEAGEEELVNLAQRRGVSPKWMQRDIDGATELQRLQQDLAETREEKRRLSAELAAATSLIAMGEDHDFIAGLRRVAESAVTVAVGQRERLGYEPHRVSGKFLRLRGWARDEAYGGQGMLRNGGRLAQTAQRAVEIELETDVAAVQSRVVREIEAAARAGGFVPAADAAPAASVPSMPDAPPPFVVAPASAAEHEAEHPSS